MKLIADSGSTKCDWMMVGDGENRIAKTMGFNPFFHTQSFIQTKLIENNELSVFKNDIEEIYYYGAGCSSSERNEILKSALASVFTKAQIIEVSEDLDGAAYATCGQEKGIVCILGTGSNSCYFDGKQVHSRIPALGYVLGDEGSGSYFGKYLLSQFLYDTMPSHLSNKLQEKYNIDKESILHNIYNRPNANVYLASFMKFASENKTDPWLKLMIHNGLSTFAKIHILSHPEFKSVPVHFVGSIAYYFNDTLQILGQELGFTVATTIKKPIEALVAYHMHSQVKV